MSFLRIAIDFWLINRLSCTSVTVRYDIVVYGHFGPKTVRHYIFGTEMSYFFCVGAEVT